MWYVVEFLTKHGREQRTFTADSLKEARAKGLTIAAAAGGVEPSTRRW